MDTKNKMQFQNELTVKANIINFSIFIHGILGQFSEWEISFEIDYFFHISKAKKVLKKFPFIIVVTFIISAFDLKKLMP